VGREGSGLSPPRQNNVQGGGDMGAIPNKLPGFQDIVVMTRPAGLDAAYASAVPLGTDAPVGDVRGDGPWRSRALYVMGENRSRAGRRCTRTALESPTCFVVQDPSSRRPRSSPTSALRRRPGERALTNSERSVQRVRKAVEPPGEARDDLWILTEVARCLGRDWPEPVAEAVWDEVRSLSPMHRGMSYTRLEELGGIQWPCFSDDELEPSYLHGRLWAQENEARGKPAAFSVVQHELPVDELDDDFPIRLTTGRRLDSYNTGVQSGVIASPLRGDGEGIDLSPADAHALGIGPGGGPRHPAGARPSCLARVDEGRRLASRSTFLTKPIPTC
jgi:formate dehydrogenase major subunit